MDVSGTRCIGISNIYELKIASGGKVGSWDYRWLRYLGVSKNNGTSKSSILIGFSIINHPFWDTQFLDTSIWKSSFISQHLRVSSPVMQKERRSIGSEAWKNLQSNLLKQKFNTYPISPCTSSKSGRFSEVLIKYLFLALAFFEVPSWCLNPSRAEGACLTRQGLYSWNIPLLPFQVSNAMLGRLFWTRFLP